MEGTPPGKGMTYADVGVNYPEMDPFKRECVAAGLTTAANLNWLREFREVEWSRGETTHVIETPWSYGCLTIEGEGTKNMAADAMHAAAIAQELEGYRDRYFYSNVAICNAATVLNDLVTLGGRPLRFMLHVAAGSSAWFTNEARRQELVAGTVTACNLARCIWGGGESSTLKGMIDPDTVVLSGSGDGIVMPKERLINPANIREGARIVIIRSTGIHANGLTMAREVAQKLPKGYFTEIEPGVTYGEALLTPTAIYAPLVDAILEAGIRPQYMVNVTGHGLAKLMRAQAPLAYILEDIFPVHRVFQVIQEHGPVTDDEMFTTFNMSVGWAIYVDPRDALQVIRIAGELGFRAMDAGYIEDAPKKVVTIPKLGIIINEEKLGIR